ncbi:MAG: type II toxin-antitoxin system HicA family toxin [Desulfobacterales bacterium]|nr:type II toxin-antitoxin system HicA family toxin [Desulfobacterales bacterium]
MKTKWIHFCSQKGSHKKFRKEKRIVIVPDPKKEIPMGTFSSIIRQSGINKEAFNI